MKNNTMVARSAYFRFELPKQFHNRILKDFLVPDFSSNDFSEIYVVFLLYK